MKLAKQSSIVGVLVTLAIMSVACDGYTHVIRAVFRPVLACAGYLSLSAPIQHVKPHADTHGASRSAR